MNHNEDDDLSRLIRTKASRFRMPDELLESIQGHLPPIESQSTKRRWFGTWLPAGSAFAAGIVLTVLAIPLWQATPNQNEFTDSHVRSLLAEHLTDVLSTDQHTVKPWFTGKLDYAPPVHDLAAAGYPLIGGRLDVIGGQNVAALIFRHGKHVINLFVFPEGRAPQVNCNPAVGFNVEGWNAEGMRWCAVSDMNGTELKEFAQLQQTRH